MPRKATKTIPVRPETKELLDDIKEDGKTYDLFTRELIETYQKNGY